MHKLRCIIVYADDMQTSILCNKGSHAKVGLVYAPLSVRVYACTGMHVKITFQYFNMCDVHVLLSIAQISM